MSPALFCVTAAQTEPLWPTRDAQMSVPEQSASPVHDWSDCWLPTTTRLQVERTEASIDAEMDEGVLP
jgi:hypothetical protein